MVDNFGVKYVKEEHVEHLMIVLWKTYAIAHEWKGDKYSGIKLDWNYEWKQVHLSMPGYVEKAL